MTQPAKIYGTDLGVGLKAEDLLAAPTTEPTEPNEFWRELPGLYVRISPPNLFANNVLNSFGKIYANHPVNS